MKNENNVLGLKKGGYVCIVLLKGGNVVMLPVVKRLANARILSVHKDGSTRVHWDGNYNLNGDFSSELMAFTNDLALDAEDEKARNDFRTSHGMMALIDWN